MTINFGQCHQNVHLFHPKQECKDAIERVWVVPCLLHVDGCLPYIVVIVNNMKVVVVVPNNLWILSPWCLPIDALFSLIATSHQGYRCCHQNYGVVSIFHSMNMKGLDITDYGNGIIISYPLPRKVLLHRLSINIISKLTPFKSLLPQNNQPC